MPSSLEGDLLKIDQEKEWQSGKVEQNKDRIYHNLRRLFVRKPSYYLEEEKIQRHLFDTRAPYNIKLNEVR